MYQRILVALLAVGVALSGEGLPAAAPQTVGLSAERLARIGKTMEEDVAAGRIPGALAMVVRKGKVAYLQTRGMADKESARPMKADTIFRIYSMSKPITSTAVMMLYEEGKIRMTDAVSKYIPEFGDLQVLVLNADGSRKFEKPKRAMTIQDLLRHTSGLTYGFFAQSAVDKMYVDAGILRTDKDLAEMMGKLSKIPLKHHPGDKWEYSVSTDVLGRVVEVASGMKLDEFLQKRILDPLKMTDTGFYVPEGKRERFAQLYTPAGKPVEASRQFLDKGTFFSGGGGLVSTASDYARFCQMLINGGQLDGARLLSRKTIEFMTIDHTKEGLSGGRGFGLGFAVTKDLALAGVAGSAGDYSWGGAAGTKFWIDPKESMFGIYMVQILPHTGLTYGDMFKVLAYQAIAD